MVDRAKRTLASELILRLQTGNLTNDDFDNKFPRNHEDPALRAVYRRLWYHWDDRYTHTLTGKHALAKEAVQLFDRCRAFLDSDFEYAWPPIKVPPVLILLRILGMRRAAAGRERKLLSQLEAFGDFDVWPYLRTEDMQR